MVGVPRRRHRARVVEPAVPGAPRPGCRAGRRCGGWSRTTPTSPGAPRRLAGRVLAHAPAGSPGRAVDERDLDQFVARAERFQAGAGHQRQPDRPTTERPGAEGKPARYRRGAGQACSGSWSSRWTRRPWRRPHRELRHAACGGPADDSAAAGSGWAARARRRRLALAVVGAIGRRMGQPGLGGQDRSRWAALVALRSYRLTAGRNGRRRLPGWRPRMRCWGRPGSTGRDGEEQEARMSTLDRLVARLLSRRLREPVRQVLAEQDPRQAGPEAHVEMYKYLVHGDRARPASTRPRWSTTRSSTWARATSRWGSTPSSATTSRS